MAQSYPHTASLQYVLSWLRLSQACTKYAVTVQVPGLPAWRPELSHQHCYRGVMPQQVSFQWAEQRKGRGGAEQGSIGAGWMDQTWEEWDQQLAHTISYLPSKAWYNNMGQHRLVSAIFVGKGLSCPITSARGLSPEQGDKCLLNFKEIANKKFFIECNSKRYFCCCTGTVEFGYD